MRCDSGIFSIGKFFVEKNAFDVFPEYQREAGAWGIAKQELFLDTLFNGYDLPKIYLHKLEPNGGLHVYAIVDGRQRLQCIWDFLDGKIKLGQQFKYKSTKRMYESCTPFPKDGDSYNDLTDFWKEHFKSLSLDVVYISDAELQDIEEIFSRLNNGERLNAAEQRNAKGGNMCKLIRKLAPRHKFFTDTVSLSSKRYQHYDIVARFLLIEKGIKEGSSKYRDLKKRFLDQLVTENKKMREADINYLKNRVEKQLNVLVKIFDKKDPLLKQAGYPQLYYLFAKEMQENYATPQLFLQIKEFIPKFVSMRTEIRALPPEEKTGDDRHSFLDEFERLTQQANDVKSLETRVSTMRRFFLQDYPKTKLRDPNRNFSQEERYVIYIRSNKKCEECKKSFHHFGEFEADHVIQWAHGGKTTLDNARALCKSCNRKGNKKIS